MKKKADPRHQKRIKIIQELFSYSFRGKAAKVRFSQETSQQIIGKLGEIDEEIKSCAPAFPLEKINKIDLAILRLAVFELKNKTVPLKVIIDEAVELAKEFGSETSFSFINGALGNLCKKTISSLKI